MQLSEYQGYMYENEDELKQLERLRYEIPPLPHWLPIPVIHIRSQVNRRQSENYKLKKKSQKFIFTTCALNVTHHRPFQVAW